MNHEEVVRDDVDVDEQGKVVCLIHSSTFSSKQLRTICSYSKLRGVKNVTKKNMLQRLVKHHNNSKRYNNMQTQKRGASVSPGKQVKCSFCLLNILCSHYFAPLFISLDDAATRMALDTGKAGTGSICDT